MRILFLCHRLPYPPASGAKIRAFHILQHLNRSHDVTLATLARSPAEEKSAAMLRQSCAELLVIRAGAIRSSLRAAASLLTPQPSSLAYFYSRRLAAAIRRALAQHPYDLVCVHSSSMAPYVAPLRGIPKLLDFTDMDSQKWHAYAQQRSFPLSWGYAIEARKLQRSEAELARSFDLCTCATVDELATLRSYGVATASGYFRNGVDCEYFQPADEPYDANTICFLGHMSYYPNFQGMLWFCSSVWPLLRKRRPGLKLFIVGADPPRAIRRLSLQPGIEVTGTVADVRPYLRRAAVSIAPLMIARGTQNKILESLAMGVPVICSPAAARGVDAVAGEHLLIAATVDEWVCAILRLLEDRSRRDVLAAAGRARMLSHHTWQKAMHRLDELLAQHIGA